MTHKFWRKETVQVAIISAATVVAASVIPTLLQLPALRKENQNLRDQVQTKTAEIQRLNILLTDTEIS
jgi:cell division protein FtsB